MTNFLKGVFLSSLLFLFSCNQKVKPISDVAQNEISVGDSIQTVKKDFETFSLNSTQGDTIITSSGTRIFVPANAFLSKSDQNIQGTVILKFREFNTPADIYFSNIPMTYDSSGVSYTFESGGMIEILGYSENEEIKIKPSVQVKISLASNYKASNFNLYQFDTVQSKWRYTGKINETSINVGTNEKEASTNPIKYYKPKLSSDPKRVFSIKYNPNLFPELAIYENVKFQSVEPIEDKLFEIDWDFIDVRKTGNSSYEVQLFRADTTIRVNAEPVIDKSNYEKALSNFNEFEKSVSKEKKERKKILASNNFQPQGNFVSDPIQREFAINGFGIWNCDRPIEIPGSVEINQLFVDRNGKKVNLKNVSIAASGQNILYRVPLGKPIQYQRGKTSILWGQTEVDEVALIRFQEISEAKKNKIGNSIVVEVYPAFAAFEIINQYIMQL